MIVAAEHAIATVREVTRQDDERERAGDEPGEHDAPDRDRLPARGAAEPVDEHVGEQARSGGARQQLPAAQPAQVHLSRRPAFAMRAACSVLRSRKAIVIGPTPPGTGVIAAATSLTASKSTSPQRPSSVRFMPTSMTTAPGLTQSACTIRGRPTAAISTSARRQTVGEVAVREWHVVTVALAAEQQRRPSACRRGWSGR